MERINFPPYNKDQLVEIAQSRLIPHPAPEGPAGEADHQVIEHEALMLAAARTTGVTGDARRMLDVCRSVWPHSHFSHRSFHSPLKLKHVISCSGFFRRAVEVATIPPTLLTPVHSLPATPSKGKARADATAWTPQPVKTKQILAVLVEMSKNPTAQFVRNCTLYEKVMLAAVVRGVRKAGVGEVEWGKVRSCFS